MFPNQKELKKDVFSDSSYILQESLPLASCQLEAEFTGDVDLDSYGYSM